MTRILILGGTAESVSLAAMLAERRPAVDVTTSLAGLLGETPAIPGSVRVGGFGGACGIRDYLLEERIDVLVDATHPFARIMALNAHDAAERAGVPRIKLVRPMWTRTSRDRWLEVDDAPDAAGELARLAPSAALITLGSRSLAPFRRLEGMRLVFRMISKPAEPIGIPGAGILLERGPFDLDHERALMRDRGIGALVTKASGGEATHAKIEAARELDLPVVMIRRPRPPEGKTATTADDVVDWLDKERFI